MNVVLKTVKFDLKTLMELLTLMLKVVFVTFKDPLSTVTSISPLFEK